MRRRFLGLIAVASLIIGLFVPASASAAEPTERTPIAVTCVGEGGYVEEGHLAGQWSFEPSAVDDPIGFFAPRRACVIWSPDTANPVDPSEVPLPSGDVARDVERLVFWVLLDLPGSAPLGVAGGVRLNGNGDFACGEGTLTNTGSKVNWWQGGTSLRQNGVDWQATFSDGVGEVTGTATLRHGPRHGETREVSGMIVVDDGATVGMCDDTFGNSKVVVHLVLS